MLGFLKRGPAPLPTVEEQTAAPRRRKQQNIKVSEDCSVTFASLANAQGLSKAALFEDMVAERLERLERQGLKLGSG